MEQLGSMEETQRLVFNLLIQQSGSECHLDQTSLSQRRDVTIIIVFCIIIHSDFRVLAIFNLNLHFILRRGSLNNFWAVFSSGVSRGWTNSHGLGMIIPMFSSCKLFTGFLPLGLRYSWKKKNCLSGRKVWKKITTRNNELQGLSKYKYLNEVMLNPVNIIYCIIFLYCSIDVGKNKIENCSLPSGVQ